LGLALCLSILGCGGPPTGSVSGTVKYKGKALKAGVVTFLTKDDKAFPAQINADGHYRAEKVLRGELRIGVTTSSQAAGVPLPAAALKKKGDNPMGIPKGMMPPGVEKGFGTGATGSGKSESVPKKYNDPKTSGIPTLTLSQAEQTHDIDLP
jgi:hypothetical protein